MKCNRSFSHTSYTSAPCFGEIAVQSPFIPTLSWQRSIAYQVSCLVSQVRHRWCELVIKHKYTKAYNQVERFLLEDQVSVIFQEIETGHHSQSQVLHIPVRTNYLKEFQKL
jgi:hypothetical protein